MASLAELYQQYAFTDGGDRGTVHSYIAPYELLLAPFRHQTRRVLEIGVNEGHGLMLWRDYFPHAEVVGVDPVDRFRFNRGLDRLDLQLGLRVQDYLPEDGFDVIFDDGSHILHEQIETYHHLRPWSRGWYFIEDVGLPEALMSALSKEPGFVGLLDLRPMKGRFDDIIMAFWHGGEASR